ncbi:MAG: FkbM family methyltransferase [Candidatus Dormibacteraeota bacterium]|nr:FkbM family methyltransferase [Candidatus Dormibacteraeota bacterium]
MISYAQNHEDVLLARALADTTSGFYIDVGAYDPTEDSVTRHFYDLGWRGINIEPQAKYAARLRAARPRDVTLQVALSDAPGTATLHHALAGDGLATIDTAETGRLRAFGQLGDEEAVTVTTLAQVCAEHCDEGTPISFLKIDVEGHERPVLEGADWSRWLPRIVVVEAAEPLTTRPVHQGWEPILVAAGYAAVLFDGVNRWYAQSDDHRTAQLLSYPPNVLDEYQPHPWVSRVEALQSEVQKLQGLLAAAERGASPRVERLARSLESLQRRYQELSDAFDRERAERAVETEHIARLTRAYEALRDRSAPV